jgi:hypothetical protein
VIPAGLPHSAAALHSVVSNPQDVFSRWLWLSIFPFGAVVNACESAYGVHRSVICFSVPAVNRWSNKPSTKCSSGASAAMCC